jgi:hypothetical protein
MGQSGRFAALQASEQEPGFDSRFLAERRRLTAPRSQARGLSRGLVSGSICQIRHCCKLAISGAADLIRHPRKASRKTHALAAAEGAPEAGAGARAAQAPSRLKRRALRSRQPDKRE